MTTTTPPVDAEVVTERPPSVAQLIGGCLHRHRLLLGTIVMATVYFLYFYMQNTHRPGAAAELGWAGWFDTGAYLHEAEAMRDGDLDWERYAYPLGYPMAAVPFLGLLPRDPFLPVNLVSFVVVVALFFATARRLVGAQLAFVGALLLVIATPLLGYTSVPWSSTPSLVAMTWWAYVAFGRRRIDLLAVVIGGLLLGWTYMARGGGEWALLAPFGAALAWHHRKDRGIAVHAALLVAILAVIVAVNSLWINAIFGQYQHPYLGRVVDVGFDIGRIPSSLWGTLVYSGREGEYWPTLGLEGFWLVFAPLGIYFATKGGRDRIVHAGMAVSLVSGFLVVGSFHAFEAAALKYNCLHYVKLWIPVLALYALMGIRRFLDNARG